MRVVSITKLPQKCDAVRYEMIFEHEGKTIRKWAHTPEQNKSALAYQMVKRVREAKLDFGFPPAFHLGEEAEMLDEALHG